MPRSLAFLHRLADDVVGQAFRTGLLYRSGFGDREVLEKLVHDVASYTRSRTHEDVRIRWRGGGRRIGRADVEQGDLTSTTEVPLPDEVRAAVVERWTPPQGEKPARGPLVVMLAATGEEGFWRRRPFATRLAEEGIASLLLENPYYGSRRKRGQRGPALATVADQFAMNLATVDEARSLLAWAKAQGYGPLGVTGYSQGGFMAAFAGALVDDRVVVVPRAAGTSAVPVFTRSVLSHGIHWPSLAREIGSERAARDELVRLLEPVDIARHPAPVAPELATVVVVRHDRFVPPEDGVALHRHWAGSELAWCESGHVTSALFDGRTHVRLVVDAFARARAQKPTK